MQGKAGLWFRPVSYTHLDVYKRQVQIGVMGHEFRPGEDVLSEGPVQIGVVR